MYSTVAKRRECSVIMKPFENLYHYHLYCYHLYAFSGTHRLTLHQDVEASIVTLFGFTFFNNELLSKSVDNVSAVSLHILFFFGFECIVCTIFFFLFFFFLLLNSIYINRSSIESTC